MIGVSIVGLSLFVFFRINNFEIRTISLNKIEKLVSLPEADISANKAIVINYYRQLFSENSIDAQSRFLAEDYVEHQASVAFSKQGLAQYIAKRLLDNPSHKIEIYRTIAQSDYVFLHVGEFLDNDVLIARGELFRVKDNKIIEHWSIEHEEPKVTASGNGMLDGANVDYTSHSGRKFAMKISKTYMNDFMNCDSENHLKNTTERYIQHNTEGKSGKGHLADLLNTMKYLAAIGIRTDLDIKKVIAEGDFVVTLSRFDLTPIIKNAMVFDIFRVTEDGKKDEHWDVLENIKEGDELSVF